MQKSVRALRIALQHKTQMPVTDEEARAILQARGGRETPVTEEEARVIFRARGDAGRGRDLSGAGARARRARRGIAGAGEQGRRGAIAAWEEGGGEGGGRGGITRGRRGDLSRDARVAVGVHRVDAARRGGDGAVSYTHLTLPTIYSV